MELPEIVIVRDINDPPNFWLGAEQSDLKSQYFIWGKFHVDLISDEAMKEIISSDSYRAKPQGVVSFMLRNITSNYAAAESRPTPNFYVRPAPA
jgi:hypothetical protein